MFRLKPAAAGIAALAVTFAVGHADARADATLRCRTVTFDVALEPASPADQRIHGSLCSAGPIRSKTIQVLLHGAGYDQRYWDFPLRPERHSYVRRATAAGYATLAIDRVGYGRSSRPMGAELYGLDLHVGAFTVHQVVQALRSGRLTVPGFGKVGHAGERVQLVGSSLGSFIAAIEASTYDDVDGVILTGFSHFPGPAGFASFGLAMEACQDEKFTALPCDLDAGGVPIGYLSNVRELPFPVLDFPVGTPTRLALFFSPPDVDADVYALDDQMRETFTAAELGDIPATLDPNTGATRNLRVPTLIANGESDFLLCDPPRCSDTRSLDFEDDFFPPEARLEVSNIPHAGHSLNLHHGAGEFFAVAREWSDRHVGASTRRR